MNINTRFGSILGVVALLALALAMFIVRPRLADGPSGSEVDFGGAQLPDIEVERQDGSTVSIRDILSDGINLVFLLSTNDCLVCQAEITRWRDLSNRHSIFAIVPIGVGGDRDTYRQIAESEIPGSEFVFDDEHSVLTALGVAAVTPTRILLDGSRVVAMSQARTGDTLLGVARQFLLRKEGAMPPMK